VNSESNAKQGRFHLPPITFFFPYKEVSGVPVLFRRMAEYVSERYDLEARIVDYADGYMAQSVKRNARIQMVPFEDDAPLNVASDTILVMQSILPYTMRPELRIAKDTRLVFWTMYQMNLVQTLIPLPWFRHVQATYPIVSRVAMNTLMRSLRDRLRDFVNSLVEKKSIFFVDVPCLRFTSEYLGIAIENPIFLPIPCDEFPINRKQAYTRRARNAISFCWLGRLADFKIHILVHLIKRLSACAARRKLLIEMHIIGDGPLAHAVYSADVEHEYFKVIRVGVLTGLLLDEYLLRHIDVLAAMGTSSLEGAKLGVPTLLLDFSYAPITKDYKFKWIFEMPELGLGDVIRSADYEQENQTLDRIIDSVLREYSVLSDKTYAYCTRNHSISAVGDKFLGALQDATFRYGDIRPDVLKKGVVRRIYEFVRDGRTKRRTVAARTQV
jgi:hypothetical protein